MQSPFFLFLGDIGGSELILIMVVILIFFGANKIPELARGLGKGIREFKDASTEIRREFEQAGQPAPPSYSQQPGYGPPNQHPASLPAAPASETGAQPWSASVESGSAAPAHSFAPETGEPGPPVAPSLPPNLAPQGTHPRQTYLPPTPNA